MFTERVALQQELNYLREQDDINRKRRQEIVSRISELDKIDREALDPNVIIDKLSEQNSILGRFIPSSTWEMVSNAIQQEHVNEFKKLVTEETTTTVHTKRTEETSERQEHKESSTTKVYVNRDLKKDSETAAAVLKEHGIPMQLKELTRILREDHDIQWNTPSTAIMHAMRHNPRINKASYGHYQYLHNPL